MSSELSQFIMTHIENVGHLEMLLLLHQFPLRAWSAAEMTRELRGNQYAIERWVKLFVSCGLAIAEGDGHRFQPASDELRHYVDEVARIYRARPALLIELIHSRSNPQLMDFVRAFDIRKKT